MSQVIRIPSDLFVRLEKLASGFDTPANVIRRLLDYYESEQTMQEESKPRQYVQQATDRPEIILQPEGERAFKSALLRSKAAWVLIHKSDGATHLYKWRATRFKKTSDVKKNLYSGYLRNWRKKGIVKCEIATDKDYFSANA